MYLGLDPSSTCTGYALLDARRKLIDLGVIKPERRKDAPIVRIRAMIKDVRLLCKEYAPRMAILESTSGKVAARRRRAGHTGAGLAVHGMAVGALFTTCMYALGDDSVIAIPENVWTRGVPKRERAMVMTAAFPQYFAQNDPGGDAADALGVLFWWFDHRGEI